METLVPVVMSNGSPIQYILKNGSVIKATLLHINRTPSNFRGEGSNPSLLQVGGVRISQGGDTNLKDLVIEMPENAFTYDPPYNGINNAKGLQADVQLPDGEDQRIHSLLVVAITILVTKVIPTRKIPKNRM